MLVLGCWMINRAGGLILQKSIADPALLPPRLTTNDYLVMASTFQR